MRREPVVGLPCARSGRSCAAASTGSRTQAGPSRGTVTPVTSFLILISVDING